MENSFANIGGIYADGVSLLFDGADTPTAKHFKCNASVLFKVGDRVRIIKDSGTYIVEYVVGAPMSRYPIPDGGYEGQYLAKYGNEDFALQWAYPE